MNKKFIMAIFGAVIAGVIALWGMCVMDRINDEPTSWQDNTTVKWRFDDEQARTE